jgi:Sec-independent protein translocase protein TatA
MENLAFLSTGTYCFILLDSAIEVIFWVIIMFAAIALIFGLFTALLSWIFGVSIGSRFDRTGRSVITPDDLPTLVKGIGKGVGKVANKLKNKTQEELSKISKVVDNKTDSKMEKLEKLHQLYKSGVITNEEFQVLKIEILKE